MIIKILKQLLVMSKYTLYGVVIQCFSISMLLAEHGKAQHKSIDQTYLSVSWEAESLGDALEYLEEQTDLNFSFSSAVDLSSKVTVVENNVSLRTILEQLSKELNLKFRRVNSNVHIAIKQSGEASIKEHLEAIDTSVTGKVSDENGQAMPGVNVLIKGTTLGTVTNTDGTYAIEVPDNATLVFSFMGFKSLEVSVGSRSVIDVVLTADFKQLSEIVVVGYGTQRRQDLTGAVGMVNESDFENNVINSPAQAIQGRVAGVQVTQNSGRPGEEARIIVRGIGTTNNTDPLVVIDGQLTTGGLTDINPNDIESISVLKDASAASIYGSRAANGVVLVQTKRGKAGETVVTFDSYYTIDKLQNKVNQLDRSDFIAFQYDFLNNGNSLPDGITNIDDFEETQFNTANTDWQDEIFRTGATQSYQLGVRGGSEETQFAISTGYFDQKGILDRSEFSRINLRLNLDHQISEKFKIGNSFSLSRAHREGNSSISIFRNALFFPPTIPVYRADGSYGSGADFPGEPPGINPVAAIESEDDDLFNNRVLGNIYGEVEIIEGLTFRTSIGIDYLNRNQKTFFKTLDNGTDGQNPLADLSMLNREEINWIIENIFTYKKVIREKHNFELISGYSAQAFNFSEFQAGREGFPSDDEFIRVLNAGSVVSSSNSGFEGEWALQSVFGRINYAYDNKYLFAFNYRADGSSRFAKSNRWGFFPALSVGWNISDEEFFDSSLINRLKLRGSWGQLGNQMLDELIGLTPFATTLALGEDYILGTAQVPVSGAAPISLGNSDITWETTTTTNVGIDMLLFNSNLSFTVDYYKRRTEDMLIRQQIPATSGVVQGPVVNAGTIYNTGIEFDLSYSRTTSKDFTYTISGNLAINTNEIKGLGSLSNERIIFGNRSQFVHEVGHQANSIYGYVADGIFQNQGEVDSAIPGHENAAPGDVRWKDVNGDGAITPDDRTIIGNIQPDLIYGISASLAFKGFDFSVLLNGESGRSIYRFREAAAFRNFENTHERWLNRWTGEGTSDKIPRAVVGDPNNNNRVSSLFVEDGDYINIRNVQLGYTLPLTQILGIASVRFYIGAQNLYRFTDYTGYTPEFDGGDGDAGFGSYPVPRSYIFGLNLNF